MEIDKKLIDRINELARKKKSVGLSQDEIIEQQKLRQEYLKLFKEGFRQNVENIKVVDEQGNDVTPRKIKEKREKYEAN